MGQLRDRMASDLVLRGLRPKTQKEYLRFFPSLNASYNRRTFHRYATDRNLVADGAGTVTSDYDRTRDDPEYEIHARDLQAHDSDRRRGKATMLGFEDGDPA